MKFRDLEKGTLGGRTEDFDVGGRVVKIRVVPLLAGRDGEIERAAVAYVEAENKAHPDTPAATASPGNPTYERGVYAHTIFRAVLDPEDGQPFFTSVDEILHPLDGLDRERLAMLFELQQLAQSDFAPRGATKIDSATFFDWLDKTATAEAGADLPFERSPRATQRAFARGIARSYKDLIVSHYQRRVELERMRAELEQARSEIASLKAKSTPGPGSPDTATSSGDSATSSPAEPSPKGDER